jgi:membrane dipeptidase
MVNFFSSFIVPSSAALSVERMRFRREQEQRLGDAAAVDAALKRWDARHKPDRGSIHTLIDHIDHIARVAGVDHVGLGSDYDGITLVPEQLEDVSRFPLITQALLDRGYTEEQIRKILGENLLRVMRAAEQAARAMERTAPHQ